MIFLILFILYRMKANTVTVSLLAIFLSQVSAGAQEAVTVGFSMGKHMGNIISKDLSQRGGIIATVAEDHTLFIWDYPSFDFKKKINLPGDIISPVSYGICAINPSNPNIVLIADDTGEVFEGNYYTRQLFGKSRKKGKIDYDIFPKFKNKEGLFYDNKAQAIQTQYSFIAVDIAQGKVVDRAGSLSAKIKRFVFSPDESFVLAVSNGEEAILYDAWGLRQVSQFVFDDEKILGVCFLTREELVFLTDVNYYKFRITKNGNNSAAEKELLIKRSVKRGYDLTNVKINKTEGIAYLFDETWGSRKNIFGNMRVSAISLDDGKKIKLPLKNMFEPTDEDLIAREGIKFLERKGITKDGVLSMVNSGI